MAREHKMTLRLTGPERELIEREATEAGMTISQFVRLGAVILAATRAGRRSSDPARVTLELFNRARRAP